MSLVSALTANQKLTKQNVTFRNVTATTINNQPYPMSYLNVPWLNNTNVTIGTLNGSTRLLLNSFGTITPAIGSNPITLTLPAASQNYKNVTVIVSFNDDTFNNNFIAGDPPATIALFVITANSLPISGNASILIATSTGFTTYPTMSQFYCDGHQWLYDGTF